MVKKTRTSTFLVREGHDTGEILCQGPWVTHTGSLPVAKDTAWEHEVIQKQQSDWPSLTFALKHIAQGEYGIMENEFHHGEMLLHSIINRYLMEELILKKI